MDFNLNLTKNKMQTKALFAFIVALLAVTFVATFASALDFSAAPYVELDSLNAGSGTLGVIAGESYRVTVEFRPTSDASNIEISAWIAGESQDKVYSPFDQDLVAGSTYKPGLTITIPEDVNPEEELTLFVRIESDEGDNWEQSYTLQAQRQSHNLDVLLVELDSSAKVGSTIAVDVVLKNMGRHEAEDTLVKIEIPELGIVKSAYFEDLSPTDVCDSDGECDTSDSRERRIFLRLPEEAQAGTYEVLVTAYTDNTKTIVSKTLRVTETAIKGEVLSNPSSQTFAVGEEAVYELLLVNTGSQIAVYNLVPSESDALSISLSDSVATVPAGSSKVVKVYVKANREGTFGFTVDVNSKNFQESAKYTASVEGKSISSNVVALTIILAIIFIVLVVILIVLLTRKPEKTEDFGESYY